MTFKHPPAAASWCLVHLSDPDEGLLGDLIEEYQRRQSSAWYWRQVLMAIVVGSARNAWTHKLETVQAVFTAMSATIIARRVVMEPVMAVSGMLLGRRWNLPPDSWTDILTWIGAALWFMAAVATGMLVARLHPARRATMTLAILMIGAVWNLPEWYRRAANVLELGPRFAPYLVNSVVNFVIVCAGILLGSLWMRGRPASHHLDSDSAAMG